MRRDRASDLLHQIITDSGCSRDEDEADCSAEFREIAPDMTVESVIRRYPDCIAIFRRHELNCCACVNSRVETIESICRSVGAPLDELLRDLNIAARTASPNTARVPFKESD